MPLSSSREPPPLMRKSSKISGGCFCGAVRYEAKGPPSNSMVCHCRTCRGITGAPVVAWVTFDQDKVRFVSGKPKTFRSSKSVLRRFCPKCGTQLTYETNKHPTTIDITTASLDKPGAFPPTHHSWLSHDVSWVRFGDNLPVFQESKT